MTINFEADQQNAMSKTENIQSLADQVERLEGLLSRIETSENNLKDLKKEYQRISGEVIPTMLNLRRVKGSNRHKR
jgi:archaellum component FlaC